jgi:hypothetical protein
MRLARSPGDRVDQFNPAEAFVDAELRRRRRILTLASWARNYAELGKAWLTKKLRKSAVKFLKSLGRVNLCAARAMLDVGFAVQAVPAIAHRGGRTPSVAQFF